MLFKDLLNKKYKTLSPAFDDLFELALKHQTHTGDLLLVNENASLSVSKSDDEPPTNKYFYELGWNLEGHSEQTNYNFIGEYVNEPIHDSKEYNSYYAEKSQDLNFREKLDHEAAFTMQFEMLIYLKIWEGETFIKKWYQLAKLIKGLDYDWSFRIKSRDPQKQGGITRDNALKNHIKPILSELIPQLGNSFMKCHKGQIRNAIAHSQYFFMGRDITFSNYIESNADHISHLNFEEWTDIFHETVVIFTLYNKLFGQVKEYYYQKSLPFKKKMEIRINWQLNPQPYTALEVLYTREFYKDWSPYYNKKS